MAKTSGSSKPTNNLKKTTKNYKKEANNKNVKKEPQVHSNNKSTKVVKEVYSNNSNKHIKTEAKQNNLILIFIVILVLQLIIMLSYSRKINHLEKLVTNYQNNMEKELKDLYKTSGKTVFLGDSIIDYYDLDKYFDNDNYINQGISGNSTRDVLDRLKSSIYDYNPDRVVLLIGTNDIVRGIKRDETIDNIKEIIKRIKKNNKKTKILVQSLSPVNTEIYGNSVENRTNDEIKRINKEIKIVCEELGIMYINTYDELTDKNGNFKQEYTVDGLHFSKSGYSKLTSIINRVLENK